MKKTATQTLLATAMIFGTAGLVAPAIAQEAEAPVELTDEELDAVMAELLEAELAACEEDAACIEMVLADYEAELDMSEDEAAPEADAAMTAEAAGAAAAAAAAGGEAAATDDEGVLESAEEADGDSDGTGGTTRPASRPD
jgi:hypothetical protein